MRKVQGRKEEGIMMDSEVRRKAEQMRESTHAHESVSQRQTERGRKGEREGGRYQDGGERQVEEHAAKDTALIWRMGVLRQMDQSSDYVLMCSG